MRQQWLAAQQAAAPRAAEVQAKTAQPARPTVETSAPQPDAESAQAQPVLAAVEGKHRAPVIRAPSNPARFRHRCRHHRRFSVGPRTIAHPKAR